MSQNNWYQYDLQTCFFDGEFSKIFPSFTVDSDAYATGNACIIPVLDFANQQSSCYGSSTKWPAGNLDVSSCLNPTRIRVNTMQYVHVAKTYLEVTKTVNSTELCRKDYQDALECGD